MRYRPEDLDRAFFSVRFSRVLDDLGYATWRRWRLYGEEGLAGKEAALWLRERTLTVEHGGEPLSRYEVEVAADTGKPRSVGRPRLFETSFATPQPRLFALAALGEAGWLKAVKLEDYAPRKPRRPAMPQRALFTYGEAWGRSLPGPRTVPAHVLLRREIRPGFAYLEDEAQVHARHRLAVAVHVVLGVRHHRVDPGAAAEYVHRRVRIAHRVDVVVAGAPVEAVRVVVLGPRVPLALRRQEVVPRSAAHLARAFFAEGHLVRAAGRLDLAVDVGVGAENEGQLRPHRRSDGQHHASAKGQEGKPPVHNSG